MSFFKPEDFAGSTEYIDACSWVDAAKMANAKLEREGEVVFIQEHEYGAHLSFKERYRAFSDTSKALLINIEPIEKCTHPREKIVQLSYAMKNPTDYGFDPGMRLDKIAYKCECGARVKPTSFEVVDETK